MDDRILGLLLGVLVVLLLVVAGTVVYYLRRNFVAGQQDGGATPVRVLQVQGVACWVELLAGLSLSVHSSGWSLAVWKQVVAHLEQVKEPCPPALLPRLREALQAADAAAHNPMISAYILKVRQLLV